MAKNVVRSLSSGGRTALLTNAAAGKSSGQLFKSPGNSGIVALHKSDQLASATGCACFIGDVEVSYAKLSTDVVAVGDIVYYDDANDWLTIVAGTLKKAGVASSALGAVAGSINFLLGEIR